VYSGVALAAVVLLILRRSGFLIVNDYVQLIIVYHQ